MYALISALPKFYRIFFKSIGFYMRKKKFLKKSV